MLAQTIFLIGIAGLAISTFAMPCLLSCYSFITRKNSPAIGPLGGRKASLAIAIPAHNEEAQISLTIASVKLSIEVAKTKIPDLETAIFVLADGCNDRTAKLSRDLGAHVIEKSTGIGKWQALKQLTQEAANFEFVALVDAGSLWTPQAAIESLQAFLNPSIAAVFPSYLPIEGTWFHRVLWKMEAILKTLENSAGGTISSHGATACYRTKALQGVFDNLPDIAWLNDDVVIPLLLRMSNKENLTCYLPNTVIRDLGAAKKSMVRRDRLAIGNLQWMRQVLMPSLFKNPLVSCMALRRVARTFWGYWLVCLAIGTVFMVLPLFGALVSIVLFSLGAMLITRLSHVRTSEMKLAFFASLALPMRFYKDKLLVDNSVEAWR